MYLISLSNNIIKRIMTNMKKTRTICNNLTDYLEVNPPVVLFTEEAKQKMWALIENSKDEIGWHGLVRRDDNNVFTIYDILVYPQEVTGASITADPKKFNDWMTDFIMKPDDTFEHIRMHGHSHVNMQCSPSGVDTKLQEDTLATLKDTDYYIFIIANKRHDIWIQIYDNVTGIVYEKADISIDPNKYNEWAITQIKECVTKPQPKTYIPPKSHQTTMPGLKIKTLDDDIDEVMSYYDEVMLRKR